MSESLDCSDCSDCFNSSGFKNISLSNDLNTISLPLISAIALFNTSSFTFFDLEFGGLVSLSNSLICFEKWFDKWFHHLPYSY